MKEGNRKRIIATLLLSVAILGQAFGGIATAQRRLYRHQNRAKGALIGTAIGLNGRSRGLIHRRVLTIPTRRRLPRTPIMRSLPTISVTSLRNHRSYGS